MKPVALLCFVLLGILPIEGEAEEWRLVHKRDAETDADYYVALLKNIPARVVEHKVWTKNRIKTRMTMMFSCNADEPTTSPSLYLLFDEAPKFSTNRRRVGSLDYYPAIFTFHKTGEEPRFLETEVFQQWSMSNARLLGIHSDMMVPFLLYERLTIGFISKWDGDVIMAKVPLKGALEVVNKVLGRCGWDW